MVTLYSKDGQKAAEREVFLVQHFRESSGEPEERETRQRHASQFFFEVERPQAFAALPGKAEKHESEGAAAL